MGISIIKWKMMLRCFSEMIVNGIKPPGPDTNTRIMAIFFVTAVVSFICIFKSSLDGFSSEFLTKVNLLGDGAVILLGGG